MVRLDTDALNTPRPNYYEEGKAAHRRGDPLEPNPYPPMSEANHLWGEGWLSCEWDAYLDYHDRDE